MQGSSIQAVYRRRRGRSDVGERGALGSARQSGLRMSQFNDDKNSHVDPMQKSIVGFFSGGGANPSISQLRKQDCLERSDKLEDHEGSDLSEGQSVQHVELDFSVADDHTSDREDDRFSLLCESHCSISSSTAEKFKMNDSYLDESIPNKSEPDELTNSVETLIEKVGLIWLDDYICSVCSIELPPSFVEERQEHFDYHVAEMLQKMESSHSRGHLAQEERFVRKTAHNREGSRKKQKCSPQEVKHIPIEAFFSKFNKSS